MREILNFDEEPNPHDKLVEIQSNSKQEVIDRLLENEYYEKFKCVEELFSDLENDE